MGQKDETLKEKLGFLGFLTSSSYIILNKNLLKVLGYNSLMFTELLEEYKYYAINNLLQDDNSFFSTAENIENEIGLSTYQQKNALDKLTELGLLKYIVKGLPAKRYIYLNIENIEELFKNILKTSFKETKKLDIKKLTTNINNINNTNNNKNIISINNTNNILEKNSKKDNVLVKSKTLNKKEILVYNLKNLVIPKYTFNEQVNELLVTHLDMLKDKNKLPTENQYNLVLKDLVGLSIQSQLLVIENSIKSGYPRFYVNEKEIRKENITSDGIDKGYKISKEKEMIEEEKKKRLLEDLAKSRERKEKEYQEYLESLKK